MEIQVFAFELEQSDGAVKKEDGVSTCAGATAC